MFSKNSNKPTPEDKKKREWLNGHMLDASIKPYHSHRKHSHGFFLEVGLNN